MRFKCSWRSCVAMSLLLERIVVSSENVASRVLLALGMSIVRCCISQARGHYPALMSNSGQKELPCLTLNFLIYLWFEEKYKSVGMNCFNLKSSPLCYTLPNACATLRKGKCSIFYFLPQRILCHLDGGFDVKSNVLIVNQTLRSKHSY